MTRALQVLLSALLLAVTSTPAWAITRSENRVGGSPVFSSDFASQESAKPIAASEENAGCGYDFASGVHKYLYAEDDPVNNVDPSGNDLASLSVATSIGASLASMIMPVISNVANNFLHAIQGPYGFPGPDITIALNNTIKEVAQVYNSPNTQESARKAAADNLIHHPWAAWDIFKLAALGEGNVKGIDFGNGSYLGLADGAYTVQFGTPPKVYYAGSVNYILWGKMFELINHHGYKPWLYNEPTALLGVTIEKIKNKVLEHKAGPLSVYADQARAFTDYGYSGKDPSYTALTGSKPLPSNVAAPVALGWHWSPIH